MDRVRAGDNSSEEGSGMDVPMLGLSFPHKTWKRKTKW